MTSAAPFAVEALSGVVAPYWRRRTSTVRLIPDVGSPLDVHLVPGRPVTSGPAGRGKADVLLSAARPVLADVTAGRRSGLDAFLDGELTVRGELSLALSLDGIFATGPAPAGAVRRTDIVDATGFRTAAYVSGPPAAPPVVLVHGLAATSASMLPIQRDLSSDHRVLSLDTVGHGDSDKPPGPYDAPMLADWLTRCLDAAGVERFALVGNSLGGRVSIEMAQRHPDRVAGVVLLCPSPAFVKLRQAVPLVRLLRAELGAAPLPPLPHAAVVRGIKIMFSQPSRLPDSWYAAGADEFLRVWRQRGGRRAVLAAMRQIYLEDNTFWTELSHLAPPSLWIWGARDRLVPHSFQRHVARALPSARQVVLDDCGHVPQFEQPDATSALVREHLATVDW